MKKLLIAVLVLVALYSLFGDALPWKSDGEAASPSSGVLPEEEAQPAQTPEDGGGAEDAERDGGAEEPEAAPEEKQPETVQTLAGRRSRRPPAGRRPASAGPSRPSTAMLSSPGT